jgi:Co/Zn/Cd efflux system component
MIDNQNNETRSKLVVLITAVTMVLEIFFGYWTNSMALVCNAGLELVDYKKKT